MALVYKLTSPSGKSYVGYTAQSAHRRWNQHKSAALSGCDFVFAKAIRKYGPEAFVLDVVADGLTEDEALAVEVSTIAALGCVSPGGYNMSTGGDRPTHTPESRAKNAASKKGKKHSPEHCAKVGNANRGKKRTPEQCARIGASRVGLKRSPEAVEKTAAAKRGRKHTPEAKAKMSAALKGRIPSDEHRAKLAEGARRMWDRRRAAKAAEAAGT